MQQRQELILEQITMWTTKKGILFNFSIKYVLLVLQRLIIRTLQVSCSSEVNEQL